MRGVLVSIFLGLFLLAGCGGESGGDGADLRVVDYNLNYNDDRTQITGSIVVSAAGLVVETGYERQLALNNFLVEVAGCEALSTNVISPDTITLQDATHTAMTVSLEFSDGCQKNSLTVRYDSLYSYTKDDRDYSIPEEGRSLGSFAIGSDVIVVEDETVSTIYEIVRAEQSKLEQNQSTSFGIVIRDSQETTTFIESDDVSSLQITSLNPDLLKLVDSSDQQVESVTFTGAEALATKSFRVQTFDKAGLAQLQVTAAIIEGNVSRTLKETLNVTVLSGPISAMSIVLVGTGYNSDSGLYEASYTIHAVDKYNNPVNTGQNVYVGAVNGAKEYGYQIGSLASGTGGGVFTVAGASSEAINAAEDTLVVLASSASSAAYHPSIMGGWEIKSVAGNTLTLLEEYAGSTVGSLTYAVGNNRRVTAHDGISTVDLDVANGVYSVNEEGLASILLTYDPLLAGKTIFLYANTVVEGKRVGTALKSIATGTGYEGSGTCANANGCPLNIQLTLKDSNEWFRNGVVYWTDSAYITDGECTVTPVDITTDDNGLISVDVNLTGADTSCTVTIDGGFVGEY